MSIMEYLFLLESLLLIIYKTWHKYGVGLFYCELLNPKFNLFLYKSIYWDNKDK